MTRFLLLLALFPAFLSRAQVQAETLVIHTTLGFTAPTEAPEPFVIPGFDPNLGHVNSVSMKVTPRTWTIFQNENTGYAGTGEMKVASTITISTPAGDSIFTATVAREATVHLPSFDGVADFQGPSSSFAQYVDTQPFLAPYVATGRRAIAPFVGVGSKTFYVHRQSAGQSFACDTANWMHVCDSRAGAEIETVIDYTPALN